MRASCWPARTRWTSPTRSGSSPTRACGASTARAGPGSSAACSPAASSTRFRLSIAPLAVAGRAARVASGAAALTPPAAFEVASLLVDDSTLLVRYVR